jgi:hypothetical protein
MMNEMNMQNTFSLIQHVMMNKYEQICDITVIMWFYSIDINFPNYLLIEKIKYIWLCNDEWNENAKYNFAYPTCNDEQIWIRFSTQIETINLVLYNTNSFVFQMQCSKLSLES